MDPLVTIVITSYNYGKHVGDAIASALAQSYRNVEVLVLDNASTDNSVEVVRSFTDERIRLVTRDENIGIQRNHNEGIKLAKGDFVVFLSADDMLLPTLVEDVLAYRHTHPDIDIVYTSAIIMDPDKNFTMYFDQPSFDGAESYYGRNEFASLLTRDSAMYLPTILFPRAIFEELGPMNETLEIVLDYEYGIRMASAGKRFGFLARPGALIRFHGENRSGVKNFVKTGKQIREFCQLLKWYTAPKYHQQLAGWRHELSAMIDLKIREFQGPFPQEFAEQLPAFQSMIDEARASIALVPDVSDNVLAGRGKISVIIPFTGRIGGLQRTLESLHAQDYGNWEGIVVVDSAFDPGDVVKVMGLSEKVRVSKLRSCHGFSHARNLGAGGVSGEIVAYLDEDNRFENGYLRTLATAFADRSVNVTLASSRVLIAQANGESVTAVPAVREEVSPAVSRVSNRVPLNSVAHRRSCFPTVGTFNRAMGILEDWEFLLRLNASYAFTPIDSSVDICVRVMPFDHPVYGRRDGIRWSEYASMVGQIHKVFAPRSTTEASAQAAYMNSLESVINRGIAGYADANQLAAFVFGVSGMTVAAATNA